MARMPSVRKERPAVSAEQSRGSEPVAVVYEGPREIHYELTVDGEPVNLTYVRLPADRVGADGISGVIRLESKVSERQLNAVREWWQKEGRGLSGL